MVIAEHRLVFIHIPKCAGRSIAAAFGRTFCHQTAHAFTAPEFRAFTKFAVVRNTWDRLVSMYHYIQTAPFHQGCAIQGPQGAATAFNLWLRRNLEARQPEFGPGDYSGRQETDGQLGSPFWFSSQLAWIGTQGEVLVDELIDFAALPEEFTLLCAARDLDLALPHENRSEARKPYREYYDAALRDLVEEHYSAEIDVLAFRF